MLIADWLIRCTVSSKSKPIKEAGFRKKLSFGKYSPRGKTEFSCAITRWMLENVCVLMTWSAPCLNHQQSDRAHCHLCYHKQSQKDL